MTYADDINIGRPEASAKETYTDINSNKTMVIQ
jgi:hypothetical protein